MPSASQREHVRLGAVDDVERVLDARHLGELGRALQLRERHVADADPADQPFGPELDHRADLVVELLVGFGRAEDPEVDDVHLLDVERAQVVLDTGAQLGRARGRQPRTLGVAAGPDLAHDDEAFGVRVQGRVDQLVGDIRAVVLRGVDVVDTELDRAPEHRDRGVPVPRRAEDARARKLHRAEADAGHRPVREPDGSRVDHAAER